MNSDFFMPFARRLLIALSVMASASANAFNWGPVDAKVTLIEPSYVGSESSQSAPAPAIYFFVDQAVGDCPAGTALVWAPYWFGQDPLVVAETIRQQSNTKAILSTLQRSITLGTKVRLYGFNMQNGTCQASNVYSLNF